MKICLSFDDGRSDSYVAFKALQAHSLGASFHVTTGFIDKTFVTDHFGVGRKPLTIDQLKEMSLSGMDITSHGDKHIMDNNDFSISVSKMKEWGVLKNGDRVGFSIPNSNYSETTLNNFVKDNEQSLSYVRVGRSPKCYSFVSKVNYVLYHALHLQFFYNSFNKHNLLKTINKNRIYSLVVKNDVKIKNLIRFIEKYKDKDLCLIIMFHSVVESPSDVWEYSLSDFEKLVDYLSNNVDVFTIKELVEECEKAESLVNNN